jgi:hypothetical protein
MNIAHYWFALVEVCGMLFAIGGKTEDRVPYIEM